jgi:hypothetical protein
MQVFLLDEDMQKTAEYYVNKHIVKIPLELTQVLCTALRENGYKGEEIYKSTHVKHPWCLFAKENPRNFLYLYNLGLVLFKEYSFRYEKKHSSEKILNRCLFLSGLKNETNLSFDKFDFPLCFPEKYKKNNVVDSYRDYVINEKSQMGVWKKRNKPEWWPK